MHEKIKVALITHAGGAHVGAYLHALASAESCDSVVLADADGRWKDDAARVLGGKLTKTYADHKTMLAAETPGMALVTMEAKLAPPVIEAALDAGCHVFAEKPACVDVRDFRHLVKIADGKHRHLMLALANRLNPEVVEARRLLSSGVIGKVYGCEIHLVADQTRLTRPSYRQQWFAQKNRAGGGHLIWLGIHWLDLAMHVTGSAIAQTAGFTANVGGQPIDVEDAAVAALRFENGSLGTMTSGYFLDKGYHSHIKLWGAAGWLHLESMKEEPLHWYSTRGDKKGTIQEFSGSKNPRGYTPFVHAAIEACATSTDPPVTSSESLRALETVFAVYRSAESGRAEEI